MMIMLGSGFDTDPQLPWATEIFNDDSIADATARIEKLYDGAMAYLDQVVGKDGVFPVEPLRSMLEYRVDQLAHLLAGGVAVGILAEFRKIWPQKYRCVGEEQLGLLIREGMPRAQQYGLGSNQGVGFFLILMFLLGHRFDSDPQYALLSDILNDEKLKTQRLGRLHATFKTELTKALD
jgi:hypothetical protein